MLATDDEYRPLLYILPVDVSALSVVLDPNNIWSFEALVVPNLF